jgi:hypothetical protein
VFYAELVCSDDGCAARFEACGTLDELMTLACDCGCGLMIAVLRAADESALELEALR